MLVGVTSSVWLYSGKTVVSWRRFIERVQGGPSNVAATPATGMGNLDAIGNGLNGTNKTNIGRGRGQAYV